MNTKQLECETKPWETNCASVCAECSLNETKSPTTKVVAEPPSSSCLKSAWMQSSSHKIRKDKNGLLFWSFIFRVGLWRKSAATKIPLEEEEDDKTVTLPPPSPHNRRTKVNITEALILKSTLTIQLHRVQRNCKKHSLPFLPRTFPSVDLPLTSDLQARQRLWQKMTGGHKEKRQKT